MIASSNDTVMCIAADVLIALQDDIVSYAELQQIIRNNAKAGIASVTPREALKQLLKDGIQIGQTLNETGTYLKFVAWRGETDERLERMGRIQEDLSEIDQGFAVWLCLKEKVDEYE